MLIAYISITCAASSPSGLTAALVEDYEVLILELGDVSHVGVTASLAIAFNKINTLLQGVIAGDSSYSGNRLRAAVHFLASSRDVT